MPSTTFNDFYFPLRFDDPTPEDWRICSRVPGIMKAGDANDDYIMRRLVASTALKAERRRERGLEFIRLYGHI